MESPGTSRVPSLVQLSMKSIISTLQKYKYSEKLINDVCKQIPDHLLDPILEELQDKRIITDVSLTFFLSPTRWLVSLPAAIQLRNSTLKQIGYNCPNLRSLDLSDCTQVSNSVVRTVLQRCPLLSELRLDRCHRVTDSAFDVAESPFCTLLGCLSLEMISLQVIKILI